MALTDPQRYPSYWHTDPSSSPRWVKKSFTPSDKFQTASDSSPKTPTNLRQTVLGLYPRPSSVGSETTDDVNAVQSQMSIISSLTPQLQRGKVKPKQAEPTKGRARGQTRQRNTTAKNNRIGSADRQATISTTGLSSLKKKSSSTSPKKSYPASSDVTQPAGKLNRQTQLTTYGIRRTARQFFKEQERQRDENVRTFIRDCVETGMKVILTEEKGRGVVATQRFNEGDFVVEYVGDLILEKLARHRESEYKKDPMIGSYMFFFVHNGRKYCVDATAETPPLGRLINHSRLHPNCVVKVIPIGGTPRLVLFAKHLIDPGEELLYDYGDRDKETMEAHPWLKS